LEDRTPFAGSLLFPFCGGPVFAGCFCGYSRLGLDCFDAKVRSPEITNLKDIGSFSHQTATGIHP
jgi:hypothetical protein